ncbi:hypothetical protein BRSPCE3_62750 [Bradyrhizobium sp. Ce-3]|nr:hypothetical protein BRSPCE3_62750 [Bradyrhizobium sp. Ce-3]
MCNTTRVAIVGHGVTGVCRKLTPRRREAAAVQCGLSSFGQAMDLKVAVSWLAPYSQAVGVPELPTIDLRRPFRLTSTPVVGMGRAVPPNFVMVAWTSSGVAATYWVLFANTNADLVPDGAAPVPNQTGPFASRQSNHTGEPSGLGSSASFEFSAPTRSATADGSSRANLSVTQSICVFANVASPSVVRRIRTTLSPLI